MASSSINEPLLHHPQPSSSPSQPIHNHPSLHQAPPPSSYLLCCSLPHATSCTSLLHETSKLYRIALPMMVTSLVQTLFPIVSLMFVGHLGDAELSGAALANSFSIVSGLTIMLGFASGLETLCGQAFGAKKYHMLGVYLQAAVITLCCMAVPLSVLWLNMEAVFILIGQDSNASAVAGKYMKWLIPSLFANAALQPLLKFLQSQVQVVPITLCSLCATALHVPLCYVLVYKTSMGFEGGAIAVSGTYWLNLLFILVYLFISKSCSITWTGWSREAILAFIPFLKFGAPSALMICCEYWSFEILVLLSGLLTNPELEASVLGICVNTESLQYMLPFGLGAGASTRVANELGAGDPHLAKFSARVALIISTVQSAIISAFFLSIRNLWGKAFSSDASVVQAISQMMPLVGTTIFLDGVQGVLSGLARGCAWQEIGAYINLGSFYGFGLPIGLVLALICNFNSMGLWGGLASGLLVQTSFLLIIFLRTNWSKMVDDAEKRFMQT